MEYSCRKKKTKREEFLESMEEIIPWEEWVGIIAPYYPPGEAWPPANGDRKDVADVSAPDLVRSVGPGDRGRNL